MSESGYSYLAGDCCATAGDLLDLSCNRTFHHLAKEACFYQATKKAGEEGRLQCSCSRRPWFIAAIDIALDSSFEASL